MAESAISSASKPSSKWGHDVLEARGYRLTASRRAILAVLSDQAGHLTPTQILDAARQQHARLNLASTYRNLTLFTRLGLVRPLYIGKSQPHYIRNDQPHHHAICVRCSIVLDFDECAALELEELVEGRYGFQSFSHLLEIYGVCQSCQAEG